MKKVVIFVLMIVAILSVVVAIKMDDIMAFYTHNDKRINKFNVGSMEVTVTEPNYENNQVIVPNETITKDPTYANTGEVDCYIRAQIYTPISKNIKYVDGNENIVTPAEEIELLTYTVNDGWVEVEDSPSDTLKFNGIYEDSKGNKYRVRTYKYVEGGQEKVVSAGETISTPVFSTVSTINYLDLESAVNLKMYASAIAVQNEGGSAEKMWEAFKNQNGTGIIGIQ